MMSRDKKTAVHTHGLLAFSTKAPEQRSFSKNPPCISKKSPFISKKTPEDATDEQSDQFTMTNFLVKFVN